MTSTNSTLPVASWDQYADHLWQSYVIQDRSDFEVFVFGTFFVHMFFFWLQVGILSIIDVTGWPKFLFKYKLDPNTVPVTPKRLAEGVALALFNQLCVSVPANYLFFHMAIARGTSVSGPIPHWATVLRDLIGCVIVVEVLFFYMHRLFHSKALYRFHKIHHTWTATIGVATVYAHPLEHIFANLLPVLGGPLVMGSHLSVYWLWLVSAVFHSTNSHSGYHFPGFPDPSKHDFHHSHNAGNFGVLGLLDWVYGSDRPYKKFLAEQRKASQNKSA